MKVKAGFIKTFGVLLIAALLFAAVPGREARAQGNQALYVADWSDPVTLSSVSGRQATIKVGDTYHMWYSSNETDLYHTASTDPVGFEAGTLGTFTGGKPVEVGSVTVSYENGKYYMIAYETNAVSGNNMKFAIYSSSDGNAWTYGGTVFSGIGLPEYSKIDGPYLFKDGSKYRLYFQVKNADETHYDIYTAESTAASLASIADGNLDADFTLANGNQPVLRPGAATAWDGQWVMHPMVVKDGGTYYMWYSAHNNIDPQQIGFAWSADGYSWVKSPAPELSRADYKAVGEPSVINDGGTWRMWYLAVDGIRYTTVTGTILAIMELDKDFYKAGELINVTVRHNYVNDDPVRIEEVSVHVTSDIDIVGIDVTCTETGLNTGVFTGSFITTTTLPAPLDVLAVEAGEVTTVTAKYQYGTETDLLSAIASVDDAKPIISGLTPADDTFVTNTAKPTISAALADAGSGIDDATAVMTVDGVVVAADETVVSISYTPAVLLSQGLHTVTVNVSDAVGNAAVPASWSFTVDTAAPIIVNQKATPNVVKPGVAVNIVFTAEVSDVTSGVDTVVIDLSAIGGLPDQAMLDNGVSPDLVAGDGIYTAALTKTFTVEKEYALTVTAEDEAGNSAEKDIAFVVSSDIVPPVIADPEIQYPFGLPSARPGDTVVISAMVTDDVAVGTVTATIDYGTTTPTIIEMHDIDDDGIYTVSVIVPVGTAKGSYPITITATDTRGNTATDESLTLVVDPAATGFEIELFEGWNLISLPLIPHTPAIETFLSELIANESVLQVVAWPYSPAQGEIVEKRWNNGALQDITEMVDGVGYWVEMSEADTLTFTGVHLPEPPATPPSYHVYAGWNLIGYKPVELPEEITASAYLDDAGGANMQAMYGFDEELGYYTQITATTILEPGNGYWLAVSQDATIYPGGEEDA